VQLVYYPTMYYNDMYNFRQGMASYSLTQLLWHSIQARRSWFINFIWQQASDWMLNEHAHLYVYASLLARDQGQYSFQTTQHTLSGYVTDHEPSFIYGLPNLCS